MTNAPGLPRQLVGAVGEAHSDAPACAVVLHLHLIVVQQLPSGYGPVRLRCLNHTPAPSRTLPCAELIERCSDGVEDQGAEEALWGQERIVSSVLEAVSRASGSPFRPGTVALVRLCASAERFACEGREWERGCV